MNKDCDEALEYLLRVEIARTKDLLRDEEIYYMTTRELYSQKLHFPRFKGIPWELQDNDLNKLMNLDELKKLHSSESISDEAYYHICNTISYIKGDK